jgi:hypothetical protein
MKFNSRAAVLAVAAAVFFLIVFTLAGSSWPLVAYRLLTDGVLVIVWLMTAGAIGRLILRRLPPELFSVVTNIALGLGFIGILVLALGLAGLLNHFLAIAILVIGLGVSAIWVLRSDGPALRRWAAEPAGLGWMWAVAAIPLAMSVVAALLPPGVLWGDEPNGYDVVEYHLQVPRQWCQSGRISPLDENVFSFFPQGVEIHYLLAMEARGGPWAGMYAAQLMHVALCALAVAAVGAIAGTLPAVVMAVTPWISWLAPVAYVEGGVLLYGALAIGWAMRGNRRDLAIAGAMAGLACGVKLTDVPMILLAIPIALLIADRRDWLAKSAAFLIVGLIVFSPWLIRDALWSGNPVFPEAMNMFGHGHFSDVQAERWRRAYVPTEGRLRAFAGQIVLDDRYGFVLLPAAIVTGILRKNRFALAMLAILAIVWLGFTHLQSRFFVLAIPISSLMLTNQKSRWWPAALIGLICFLLACQIATVGQRLIHYLADVGGEAVLGHENLAGLVGPDPTTLAPDTQIDLVGDAKAFLYPYPHVNYRTVFDAGSSGNVVEDWTGHSDIPPHHLLVIDPAELHRLHQTYFQISELSQDELTALARRPDVFIAQPAR